MEPLHMDVYDGKYTFRQKPGDYRVYIDRYDQPWMYIDEGCNAVLALCRELEEARKNAVRTTVERRTF